MFLFGIQRKAKGGMLKRQPEQGSASTGQAFQESQGTAQALPCAPQQKTGSQAGTVPRGPCREPAAARSAGKGRAERHLLKPGERLSQHTSNLLTAPPAPKPPAALAELRSLTKSTEWLHPQL